MPDRKCVIVGASHAGVHFAMSLRRLGWQGSITIVGEEQHHPYHRPPLSKDYLKGKKQVSAIQLSPAAAFERVDVQLLLGRRAVRIDRKQRQIHLDDEQALGYDIAVLAVGARPRLLPVPGVNLPGVYYLRNIDDVDRIRAKVQQGDSAVVIGGGYIGLEAAASLRMLGMDVTVVEAMDRVLQRVTSEPVSRFYKRVHTEEGVRIFEHAQVRAIIGTNAATGVELESGDVVAANLVIVGIGVVPNTELAAEAGLDVGDGVLVNAEAQTSDPAIYAVGDCSRFVHARYEREMRLESVQNANDQAMIAAKSAMGVPESYESVPWFWSDQYDTKLQIAGLAEGADETIIRGDPDAGRSLSVLYLKDGKLLAVDAINSPRDFVQGKKLILVNEKFDARKLVN